MHDHLGRVLGQLLGKDGGRGDASALENSAQGAKLKGFTYKSRAALSVPA